jgi:hypothetical protein
MDVQLGDDGAKTRPSYAESTALARDACEQPPDRLAAAAAELFADDILLTWA